MLPEDLKRITEHRDAFDLDLPWWSPFAVLALFLIVDLFARAV